MIALLMAFGQWKKDEDGRVRMLILMMVVSILCVTYSTKVSMNEMGYTQGQQDALKGKCRFKMDVRYGVEANTYVPKDTIFIKNDEKYIDNSCESLRQRNRKR